MTIKVIADKDRGLLFEQVADRIFRTALFLPRDKIIIALPGGRSVSGFLEALLLKRGSLATSAWRKFHFFMLDERLVPASSSMSNFRQLDQDFFQLLLAEGVISHEQLHPFNERDGISEYNQQFKKVGCNIDIAVLGVGEDGHVASLFPMSDALSDERLSYIIVEDSPKLPARRLTASAALISSSTLGFALFIGEEKRKALLNYMNDNLSVRECPAKILDTMPEAFIVTDLAAPCEDLERLRAALY